MLTRRARDALLVGMLAATAAAGYSPALSIASPARGSADTALASSRPAPAKRTLVAAAYVLAPTAAKVGTVSGSGGAATFRIACQGLAGTSCGLRAVLRTVERLRHGRVIGLRARARAKTVTIAAATLTAPAGHTVKVSLKLNSAGRKLLARFRKLPARLSAAQEGPAGNRTIIAQNVTVTARARHRRTH